MWKKSLSLRMGLEAKNMKAKVNLFNLFSEILNQTNNSDFILLSFNTFKTFPNVDRTYFKSLFLFLTSLFKLMSFYIYLESGDVYLDSDDVSIFSHNV